MIELIEILSMFEIRKLIRFLHSMKNSLAEIHRQFVEMYSTCVRSQKQAWFWCMEVDKSKTDVPDERAG